MNTFKKILSFLSVMILVLCSVSARTHTSTNTLYVNAKVPENYGVAFPDNAIRFGDFVLEATFDIDTELKVNGKEGKALMQDNQISIGEIKPGLDNFDFTLVYYGNLSKPYRAEIVVDPNIVWVLEGEKVVTVPIEVTLKKNERCDGDIICFSSKEGNSFIEIPPSGPRHDVPVLDVVVSWDGNLDLIPGTYVTELIMDMRVI